MTRINVRNGTPKSGPSKCYSCKHAALVKGQNNEELVFCDGPFANLRPNLVPFPVAECGRYHPANMPWKYEMELLAWEITARKRARTGFQPETIEVQITPPKARKDEMPD